MLPRCVAAIVDDCRWLRRSPRRLIRSCRCCDSTPNGATSAATQSSSAPVLPCGTRRCRRRLLCSTRERSTFDAVVGAVTWRPSSVAGAATQPRRRCYAAPRVSRRWTAMAAHRRLPLLRCNVGRCCRRSDAGICRRRPVLRHIFAGAAMQQL